MFFNDPVYMIISVVGMILVFLPQMLVKNTYSKYTLIKNQNGITGAQAAQAILNDAGIQNIKIEPTQGELTDHYDPSQKVIRLSQDIYYGDSIAAVGVAAHEVGHAIQDNRGYLPMKLRAGLFPAVQAGQMLGPILMMAGLGLRFFMGLGGFTDILAITGIVLYGSVVAFHLVTLPVEFDASFRALRALSSGGYITSQEAGGARSVLSAAAMTYVAVALYALIELLYWIWVLFGKRDE